MDQPLLSADAVIAALHWRYATKKFDPARKLPPEEWAKFDQVLALSPSSYGLQPYRFVVVTDPALREKLRAAAYGQAQITDASHLVVFTARTDLAGADVDHHLDRVVEVRGVDRAHLEESYGQRIKGDVVDGPRHAVIEEWCARQAYIALGNLLTRAHLEESYGQRIKGDVVDGPRHAVIEEWCARQAYIALGNLLTFAALVSVDACPMEGFDNARFDEILDLPAQGYRAVVLAAVGHRAADDGAASLPKVRLPENELIVHR